MMEDNNTIKIRKTDSGIHIVQFLMYTFASNILIAAVLFAIGESVTWHLLFLSFATALILTIVFYGRKVGVHIIVEVIAAIVLFVILTYLAGLFYDFSWDGNAYHKLAVGLLRNHWNPLKELPSLELTEGAGVSSCGYEIWCETYCKATWLFAASIYAVTGNIETGKVYTMLGMVCAFFMVLYFLRKKGFRTSKCVFIALAASLNPISVQQMWSFYLDGFLHSILLILIVSLLMFEDKEHFDARISASLIAAAMIVCGNIKFTGLLYGGIFCIVYYIWDCIKNYKLKNNWIKNGIKEAVLYALLALVTVCWAGSSTYITNLIRHGSFTYPLTGEGKIDIITSNSPFAEENHFINLFISLFSKMDNAIISSGSSPKLKIPFTFSISEIKYAIGVDNRISGFGVWFSGILIVSMIAIAIGILRIKNKKVAALIALNTLVCLGLAFGIKESWWARYAPYIYFIVLLGLIVVFLSEKNSMKVAGIILSILVLINNCIPLGFVCYNYSKSNLVEETLSEFANSQPIEVCTQNFEGVYFNLKDKNINYRVNNELIKEEEVSIMPYGNTMWRFY